MILKIKKDCFKNLDNGIHNLKLHFKDGYADSEFEVKNKISFIIMDTAFTATEGMTWGDWIMSYNIGTSGNNILWVAPYTNDLYLDCRDFPTWSQGLPIGSAEDEFFDSKDVRQTLNTPIVNGGVYGRASNAPQ